MSILYLQSLGHLGSGSVPIFSELLNFFLCFWTLDYRGGDSPRQRQIYFCRRFLFLDYNIYLCLIILKNFLLLLLKEPRDCEY